MGASVRAVAEKPQRVAFFAPGHDQKLRSRLEKSMEEAGHVNGLLAIENLVSYYFSGGLAGITAPAMDRVPANQKRNTDDSVTARHGDCLSGCGGTPKVGVWMSGHDGDFMKETHGIVREAFGEEVSTTYLIRAWARGICAGIKNAAR